MSLEIALFIVLLVGYCIGFHAGRRFMIHTYAKLMAENTDDMIEHLKNVQKIKILEDEESHTEVVVEQHNNSFFVYNKTTKLFLGQGPSIDEAMKIATERFPNQVFFYEEAN